MPIFKLQYFDRNIFCHFVRECFKILTLAPGYILKIKVMRTPGAGSLYAVVFGSASTNGRGFKSQIFYCNFEDWRKVKASVQDKDCLLFLFVFHLLPMNMHKRNHVWNTFIDIYVCTHSGKAFSKVNFFLKLLSPCKGLVCVFLLPQRQRPLFRE
jgi:hypothetical protein